MDKGPLIWLCAPLINDHCNNLTLAQQAKHLCSMLSIVRIAPHSPQQCTCVSVDRRSCCINAVHLWLRLSTEPTSLCLLEEVKSVLSLVVSHVID